MAQRSREERLLEQLLNKTTKVDLNTDSLELTVGGKYDTGSRGLSNGDIVPVSINASGETIVALSAIDNAVLDAMVIDLAAMEVLLTAIDADTNSIKTAVEILDNAISGNEMQVDVVASLPAGANTIGGVIIAAGSAAIGTVALSATDNAVLDTIDAVLDTIKIDTEAIETATEAIQTDAAAIEVLLTSANVDHAANEVLLTAIDADTNAIKDNTAAIEVSADALIAANHTDLLAIEASADALIAANHSDLVTLAGRISNVESGVDELIAANHTDLVAIDAVLDTIDADTNAMKVDLAAIEVLSTAANVDLAAMEVLLTAANVDHAANEVLLTGIAGVVKAEDAAHSNGDKGIMSLAVRNDALATLAGNDGDYAPLQVDATGALFTNNQFGTFGSILVTGTTATTCGVADRVFVAIYMLTNTVFNASSGLVAETTQLYLDDTGASTDIDADGGAAIDSITFPAGMTLYGRYTGFTLASGSVVAYVG